MPSVARVERDASVTVMDMARRSLYWFSPEGEPMGEAWSITCRGIRCLPPLSMPIPMADSSLPGTPWPSSRVGTPWAGPP